MKKIAIMTAGGDCTGLNAAIKSVVLTAIENNVEVLGIIDGYKGFVEGLYRPLNAEDVADIEELGGTVLGSSNKECPFYYLVDKQNMKYEDKTDEGIKKLKEQGVEGLIVIGGDGTLDSARVIHERGLPTVGIPKTIDNDMMASMPTIGFDTAVETVTQAISRVRTTAYSHRRVITVEIMGRTSGFLTLYSGVASSADVILLPEKDYDLDKVCERIEKVTKYKRYAIVAISEAAKEIGKKESISKVLNDSFDKVRYGGAAEKLAKQIEEKTGIECRHVVLGHVQRGGRPSSSDILLGLQLGNYAFELLYSGDAGYIVGMNSDKLVKMEFPHERVPRVLDLKTNPLVRTARAMGICFGD
ncbi:MAG: ATP-dependent 6-phosphofructokinase [Clostridia bacterium]|nr:ATP-dependent 6-phosphofructokinase [Clostridia bacterium]